LSSRTFRSFACDASGSSPISSRKIVPPCASSNWPFFPERAGERARVVAEELGLDERLGERAAVHLDERLRRAARRAVKEAREQALAGAGLAFDQHGRIDVGDLRRGRQHVGHRRAREDQVFEARLGELRLQPAAARGVDVGERRRAALALELVLQGVQLRDVPHVEDHVADLAVGAVVQARGDEHELAVATADERRHRALAAQRLERRRALGDLAELLHLLDLAAEPLLARDPRDALERGVDLEEATLGVEHADAVERRGEDRLVERAALGELALERGDPVPVLARGFAVGAAHGRRDDSPGWGPASIPPRRKRLARTGGASARRHPRGDFLGVEVARDLRFTAGRSAQSQEGPMTAEPIADPRFRLSSLLERAARYFPEVEVVTRAGGQVHRTSWSEVHRRARRLASSLRRLGLEPGDCVGSFAWNTFRHVELYYAVPGAGLVLHTLNLRLFPEQVAWVANHAEDRVIFVDASLLRELEKVAPHLKSVRTFVVMGSGPLPETSLAPVLSYEDLVAAGDESEPLGASETPGPALACYTSGTTGNPKGVIYDHAFLVNVARTMATVDNFGIGERDTIFTAVPLFHAAGWCLPYVGAMTGAKLVLPGPNLQPTDIIAAVDAEKVTFTAGVPTLWSGVADLLEREGRRLEPVRRIICAGSAVPAPLIARYAKLGIDLRQAWGMTECLVGTLAGVKSTLEPLTDEERVAVLAKQGRPVPFLEIRITDPEGIELPWDGQASGELEIRGPTVVTAYHRDERNAQAFREDGWFRTGDVASIDAHGYLVIRDRTKDVIKSGGEWISSLDLEAALLAHPKVAEVAVIAQPDEKWVERPLACIVARGGEMPSAAELHAFLASKVARWWSPDAYAFVPEIPKTSVGKLDKKRLREKLGAGELPVVRVAEK
jgi:acyl-CoA synthetase (AMP-forming)/AMP-acid ligase II